ncbi:hypothetical protein BGZ60DRAFT_374826 [Tricladium varicosporioides]|nr:hypothetical protein BGZ60DRAFT_374826 [Hymenoscyphus varicosporioides]
MKYLSVDNSPDRFEYPILDNQKIILSQSEARYLATDLALRLGGEEKETALHLLSSPLSNPELRQTRHEIAKSRRAWRYLKDGILYQAKEKRNETLAEFERIKSALKLRIENGVQRPFQDRSMRELVEVINKNTLAHDTDEATDDAEIEFIKDNNLVGNRTLLHPPATREQISEIEEKFAFPLPEDYKEFLSITNGLEGVWNGYFRARHLESIDHITKGDDLLTGDSALPFELITWEELPFTVMWPLLDLDRALSLNAGGDDGETWLVEPTLVQEAVKAFLAAFETAGLDEQGKRRTERIVADYFGSLREMKDMKYALLTWTHWGVTIDAWGSFRDFLEGVAVESEREVSLD